MTDVSVNTGVSFEGFLEFVSKQAEARRFFEPNSIYGCAFASYLASLGYNLAYVGWEYFRLEGYNSEKRFLDEVKPGLRSAIFSMTSDERAKELEEATELSPHSNSFARSYEDLLPKLQAL